MDSDKIIDMESNYKNVLESIKNSKIFESYDVEKSEDEISCSDSIKVRKLFDKGIITHENIFNELGLIIFHEYGHYGIADARRWMLGRIKYAI